jgi:hypothetical protein
MVALITFGKAICFQVLPPVIYDQRGFIMRRSCLCVILGVSLPFLVHTVSAQSPAAKPAAPSNNNANRDKSEAQGAVERIAKERRTNARLLLVSLASEVQSYRDQVLRARSMARIADTLWNTDAEQGRALFRKAWESAEIADGEDKEPPTLGHEPLNLRREVLALAARHDRLLAEELLQKLKAEEAETRTGSSENNLWSLQESAEKRLDLAENLLSSGDIERALQFADPVLGRVTISTIEFLTRLREKNPAAADRRYASLLANTGGNMQANANTISVLASYIFTPHMYVLFNASGGADTSARETSFPPATVDPSLRLAFFQTAGSVLLRPHALPEQDQSAAGIAARYMVIKRLMPLFEQYAPQEMAATMRARLEALNSSVSDSVRQSDNEWVRKGISPEKQIYEDRERSLLDQIERARMADERDDLYFQLATLALDRSDMKARDYVGKIDESEFRKRAQAWVDWRLSFSAIEKKKVEMALELVRIGDLTHIQRLYLLAQTAKLLAKTNRDKALSLLDDATAESRRIDVSDKDRPRGLLAIANALKAVEPSRVWDAAFDVVRAANSTEKFTGEDSTLMASINSKSLISSRTDSVPDFLIEGIFSKLAKEDFDRAAQLARGFQGQAPRVNATIAVAQAVLNEKSAATLKPKPVTQK